MFFIFGKYLSNLCKLNLSRRRVTRIFTCFFLKAGQKTLGSIILIYLIKPCILYYLLVIGKFLLFKYLTVTGVFTLPTANNGYVSVCCYFYHSSCVLFVCTSLGLKNHWSTQETRLLGKPCWPHWCPINVPIVFLSLFRLITDIHLQCRRAWKFTRGCIEPRFINIHCMRL